MQTDFRIGEAAQMSGCSPETIRHYERLGLLGAAPRSAGGYRVFDRPTIERLGFIRHGRELGLDLETIRELLALADDPDAECGEADRIAARHLALLEVRIAAMQKLAEELRSMTEQQCAGHRVAECRIIEALFRGPCGLEVAQDGRGPAVSVAAGSG
ncbi:MAG TPA: helix-turn-helix domain-containing protein [Azoarcus taiwanensis]|uniref:MerR family DNA-binding protein n=1 Tax=Azoarcus taiwanensis TaxID=666964 RepID=A0A972FAK1_9RHOO|nr:helix-turn-helix domain-containing protein [Azoarcus taiwanensis]NMG01667.1 MerR family DNA-binding protein [Azoarcus taiwanensis]HRQ56704.1 helix-turn-helix domain-containing protein [Azoarcus taiwanensis]